MRRLTTVRYGSLKLRGLFTVETGEELKAGDTCVIQSSRGTELGVILAKPIEDGQGEAGCGESACGSCATSQGTVVRRAAPDEVQRELAQKKLGVMTEVRFAREKSREYRLGVKIVGAEYLFAKEKLILHFASNSRAELHQFVRDLGQRFKTRIEMKPIGARDEARLTGDVASCGRELCCKSFLHDLQPVSMRMAKQQKKTLDPTKIAGQCGKLKCCLRYEDSVYVELQKSLPRRNAWVRIEQGLGRVVNSDLLLQKLVIELENGERAIAHVSQLLETGIKPPRPPMLDPRDRGAESAPVRRVGPARVGPARIEEQANRPGPAPTAPNEDDELGGDGSGDPNLEG